MVARSSAITTLEEASISEVSTARDLIAPLTFDFDDYQVALNDFQNLTTKLKIYLLNILVSKVNLSDVMQLDQLASLDPKTQSDLEILKQLDIATQPHSNWGFAQENCTSVKVDHSLLQSLKDNADKNGLINQSEQVFLKIGLELLSNILECESNLFGQIPNNPTQVLLQQNLTQLINKSFERVRPIIQMTTALTVANEHYSPAINQAHNTSLPSCIQGKRFSTDYQRNANGDESINQISFNTGMAAFNAIKELLIETARVSQHNKVIIFGGNPYFEISSSLNRTGDVLDVILANTIEELQELLSPNHQTPLAIFTVRCELNSALNIPDIQKCIEIIIAKRPNEEDLITAPFFIVDTTFSDIPRTLFVPLRRQGITTIAFKSLVKFGQLGLDLSGAGEIYIETAELNSGPPEVTRNLLALRTAQGTTPPRQTCELIRFFSPFREEERKRLSIHSRNAAMIAHCLFLANQNDNGFFEITSPSLPSHSSHSLYEQEGPSIPLLVLKLKQEVVDSLRHHRNLHDQSKDFNSKILLDFIKRSLDKAEQEHVALIDGSSYGHRITRIAAYEGNDNIGYIRLAPGLETKADLLRLIKVLHLTIQEHYQAWTEH